MVAARGRQPLFRMKLIGPDILLTVERRSAHRPSVFQTSGPALAAREAPAVSALGEAS